MVGKNIWLEKTLVLEVQIKKIRAIIDTLLTMQICFRFGTSDIKKCIKKLVFIV